MPEGLTQGGVNLLSATKADGVKAATVNVMAMDYGPAYSGDMGTYAEQAATATQAQVKSVFGDPRQAVPGRGQELRRRHLQLHPPGRLRVLEGLRRHQMIKNVIGEAVEEVIKETIKKAIKVGGRM